jgi:hypothetical protein
MEKKERSTSIDSSSLTIDDYSLFLSQNEERIQALKKLLKELESTANKPKSQNQ